MKQTVPRTHLFKGLFKAAVVLALTPLIVGISSSDGNAGVDADATIPIALDGKLAPITLRVSIDDGNAGTDAGATIPIALDGKLAPITLGFQIDDGNAGTDAGATIPITLDGKLAPVLELSAETGDANIHVSALCTAQIVTVLRVSGGVRSKTKEVLNDVNYSEHQGVNLTFNPA